MKKQKKEYSTSSNNAFSIMKFFKRFSHLFTRGYFRKIYNSALYALLRKSKSQKLNNWLQKRLQIKPSGDKRKYELAKSNIKFPGDRFNPFKPTILDKYLLRDFLKSAFGALFLFIFIFIVTQLINELPYFFQVSHNLPSTSYIVYMYILRIPYAATLLAPAAFLFSTVFTLGNFYQNNEVVAAIGSGVYLFRFTRPLWLLGLAFSIFLIAFTEFVSVPTWDKAQTMNEKIRYPDRSRKDQMNLNITGEGNLFYSMIRYDAEKQVMINPIVIKERKNVNEVESKKFKQFTNRIIETQKKIEREVVETKKKEIQSQKHLRFLKKYHGIKNEKQKLETKLREINQKISDKSENVDKLQDLNKILEIKKQISQLQKQRYELIRSLNKTKELFSEFEKTKNEHDKIQRQLKRKNVAEENQETRKSIRDVKVKKQNRMSEKSKNQVPFYKKYSKINEKNANAKNTNSLKTQKKLNRNSKGIKKSYNVDNKNPFPGIRKRGIKTKQNERPKMGEKVIEPDTLKPVKKKFKIQVKNVKKPIIPLYIVYRIDADRIKWDKQKNNWIVQNGVIRYWDDDSGLKTEKIMPVKNWVLPSKDEPYHFEKNVKKITRMTIPEGIKLINKLKRSNKKYENELVDLIGYHFAFQFGAFLIIFIGITVGKFHSRKNLFVKSFFMSLLIFLSYYVIFQLGSSLGKQKIVNPYIAPWLGNVVFLIAGFIRRKSSKT